MRRLSSAHQTLSIGASSSDFDYNERIVVVPLPENDTPVVCAKRASGQLAIPEDAIDDDETAAEEMKESIFRRKTSNSVVEDDDTPPLEPANETSVLDDMSAEKNKLTVPTDLQTGKAWTHGFNVPYVFFEYHRQKQSRQKVDVSVDDQDIVYVPTAVLREPKTTVSSRDGTRNNSIDSEEVDEGVSVLHYRHQADVQGSHSVAGPRKEAKVLTKDVARSNLAPYFSIPSATLTVPKFLDVINNPEYTDFKNHFVKICYQNHYDLNETIYTFGGLYLSDSLKHLGIPNDTDLSNISVYFPFELPPYVNSDIIKNPLMNQSNLFFSFDPINSRIDAVENITDENYPFNINALQSTRISDRHIFFYGGWTVNIDSVEHVKEEGKWIVRKSFKLNEYGYILNAFALKFTKVELHSKKSRHSGGEVKLARPRLGACMVSSTIEEGEGSNEGTMPTQMTVHSSGSSNAPSTDATPSSPHVVVDHALSVSTAPSKLAPHALMQASTNTSSSVTSQRSAASNLLSPVIPETVQNSKGHLKVITSNDLSRVTTLDTVKSLASASIAPSNHSSQSSSAHASRMAGVLLNKSKSIFHRSNSSSGKQAPLPSASSFSRSKGRQNSSGSLTSPSKNGGSLQTSSNSANTTPSPTVKPTLTLKLSESKTGDDYSKAQVRSPTSALHSASNPYRSSAKVASFVEEESSLKSSKSFASMASNLNENSVANTEMATPSDSKKEELYFGANASSNGTFQDNIRSESSCKQSTLIDREPKGVTIFIFGGFTLNPEPNEEGMYYFSTTSEMVKIELGLVTQEDSHQVHGLNYSKIHFKSKATIQSLRLSDSCACHDDDTESHVSPGCDNCWWPEPRGYFASALVDNAPGIVEACELRVFDTTLYKVGSNTSYSQASEGESSRNPDSSISENAAGFFSRKLLIIHGGVNGKGKTYADFNIFSFSTGRWELMTTYSHDYFNAPKQPFEDDDSSLFTKERETSDCPLVEAELRACHHTMLYYKWEDRGYLFFLGGFMNDYLRLVEEEPYHSDKFDVTRLARFQFSTNNTNLLRIPILNLQTQTWSYLRYYYDVNALISEEFQQRLRTNSGWSNARFSNYGGCISINGKVITMCHGLVVPVPERAEDLNSLQQDCPRGHLLWGAHVFITFPIM